MTIPSTIQAFLRVHSCEDLIKVFFINDIELVVNASKEAIGITQKILDLDEPSSVEVLKRASSSHVIALLLLLSLHMQYINIVNRIVHKLSVALRYDLNNYDAELLVEYARALDLQLNFSEKCFLETMYIAMKNKRHSVVKTCYNYKLAVTDYLKIAKPLLTEESWKLISFPISKGYVYVDSKIKVARLLSEYLKHSLMSKLYQLSSKCTSLANNKDFTQVLDDFRKALGIDKFNHLNDSKKSHITPVTSIRSLNETIKNLKDVNELYNISKNSFPPCINSIIEVLMRGENISHHQRFALATFLINLGVPQNIIIELFKCNPDFNEKITKYQIEHLQGLRGSRKRYLTYSCDTMKTLNMCKGECGIKNPLQYLYKVALKNRNPQIFAAK
jgi:DNA primase large subunit